MSRAMNILLDQDDVTERCKQHGIVISAIEPLPGAGTHLVCKTSEGADAARIKFKAFLIKEKVKRFAFYRAPSSW